SKGRSCRQDRRSFRCAADGPATSPGSPGAFEPAPQPLLEPLFHADSFGYRPVRSAIDAVRKARQRCWRADFVLDIDIKGFFDSSIMTCFSGRFENTPNAHGCCSMSNAG
ncbi:hypothetical protein PY365_24205, partial [Roseiarcaceae bacterium H3SJ34-1]|nr:hypothetical protein [Roseiarcaceae bacterium H3SJ34-1]